MCLRGSFPCVIYVILAGQIRGLFSRIKLVRPTYITAQNMKFSIEDFFSKRDQIRSFLRIWSRLLKKSSMENFIFCEVEVVVNNCLNNHLKQPGGTFFELPLLCFYFL